MGGQRRSAVGLPSTSLVFLGATAIIINLICATSPVLITAESNSTPTSSPSSPPQLQSSPATTEQNQNTSETTNKPTPPPPTIDPSKHEQMKQAIIMHTTNTGPNRWTLNKPTSQMQSTTSDFAPDSMEAKVSDATSQFGLKFINNLMSDEKENVVISPLSLQNLLNMLLLGTGDNSATNQELVKLLGYESFGLLNPSSEGANTSTMCLETSDKRLKPHEAMKSVFESIMSATHLNVNNPQHADLLNTNPGSIQGESSGSGQTTGGLSGALQTTDRENHIPLVGQVNFTLANLVLTNKDLIKLGGEYEKELQSFYDVQLEEFSRTAAKQPIEPLHERINKWVMNKTNDQIRDLAKESDLSDPNLIMVLLNAAHFKGRWLHTFATRATTDSPFYNNGLEKEAKNVKFMRQKGTFGYADFGTASLDNDMITNKYWQTLEGMTKQTENAETLLTEDKPAASSTATSNPGKASQTESSKSTPELSNAEKAFVSKEAKLMELTMKLNCSVLMMPFSVNDGQELSMIILLPSQRDGLPELQNALNAEVLNEIYKSLNEQTVQVELPKFTFEASYDAKSILQKLGLLTLFDKANFDRMFDSSGEQSSDNGNGLKKGSPPVKVDKIIHKAKILVDESGAEAAAASMGTVMLRNSIRPPAPRFIADHPFLFIIRHNRSNIPLFMGRVNKL